MTNWPSTSSLMTRVGSALEPSVGSETVISWFLSHVCTSWTKHKESRRQCGSSPSTRQFKSFHSVDSSGKIIYTLNVYNESCCLQMNIKFKKISHLTAFFVRMINFSSKGNKKPLKCLMKQIVYTVRRNNKIKRKKRKDNSWYLHWVMHQVRDEDFRPQGRLVVRVFGAFVLYSQLSILHWYNHRNVQTSGLGKLPKDEVYACPQLKKSKLMDIYP